MTRAYPAGAARSAMICAVRAACLAVSSISIAQTCPAYGLAAIDGHQISARRERDALDEGR